MTNESEKINNKNDLIAGFKRKEFRGKLAIAITANFKNNRTTAEAVVEEISGVAFVYKQDFFNNLYEELGIALENIVYYKDETHYFVMTTKKHSLLDRGVLREVKIDVFLIPLIEKKEIEFRISKLGNCLHVSTFKCALKIFVKSDVHLVL